jgi:hypothetical protein
MKGLEFIYKIIERRRRKRVIVYWDAVLEAKFPDFQGQINVKVINFSVEGALLHSERLDIDRRHLVVAETKPELMLKITMPGHTFEFAIGIVWYNILYGKSIFEIGINFIDLKKELNPSFEELISIAKTDRQP